jgi:hypothetical protein
VSECGTPIACSLDAADLRQRIEEWRQFRRDHVGAITEDGAAAQLELDLSEAALISAVSLSEQEKACCPFFEFSIAVEPGRRTLQVSVPPEAADVLGSFVEMLGASS